jgi:hypothetical protein
LDGPADTLSLDRYSPALVLMSRHETGPLTAGWNRVPLPSDWAAVAGLSFVRVSAQRAGMQSLPVAPLRLFWMP